MQKRHTFVNTCLQRSRVLTGSYAYLAGAYGVVGVSGVKDARKSVFIADASASADRPAPSPGYWTKTGRTLDTRRHKRSCAFLRSKHGQGFGPQAESSNLGATLGATGFRRITRAQRSCGIPGGMRGTPPHQCPTHRRPMKCNQGSVAL